MALLSPLARGESGFGPSRITLPGLPSFLSLHHPMNLSHMHSRHVFFRYALGAMILLAWATFGPALAQTPPVDPASPRGKLENVRNVVGSVEAALRSREPGDAELLGLRQSLEPLRGQLRELIDDAQPAFDQARSQLEQLGPKSDKGTAESSDIAQERSQREKTVSEFDDQLKLGRTLLLRTEQLVTEVSDRRRTHFARELFSRSNSLFSYDLWSGAIQSFPGDIAALRLMVQDWAALIRRGLGGSGAFVLLSGLMGAAALFIGRAWALPRIQAKLVASTGKSQFQLVLGAILQVLAGTLPAALGCFMIFNAARAGGFAPDRFEPVLSAALNGIVFYVFIKAMTGALLAPDAPERRFFGVADRNAVILARMARHAALVVVVAKLVEALLQSTAAALSSSIVVRGMLAIAFALAIARGLQALRDTEPSEDDCLGPYVPIDGARVAPFRLVGWLAVIAIIASALSGYISLGTFLTDQTVWLFMVAVVTTVMFFLIDGMAAYHHDRMRAAMATPTWQRFLARSREADGYADGSGFQAAMDGLLDAIRAALR